MLSICGMDCCDRCDRRGDCGGCVQTQGHPFGGSCVAAECVKKGGAQGLADCKNALIGEFNRLGIPHLHIEELHLLNGAYVNLEYPLPGGQTVQFLADNQMYWGNQVEIPGSERCYGLVAGEGFLLVAEYGCQGAQPELALYKRREAGPAAPQGKEK